MINKTTTPNVLFVINQRSGSDRKNYEQIIKTFAASRQWTTSFYTLLAYDDGKELIRLIAQTKPGTVVAVGGDGTITMVAKLVAGTETKLGIIPAGSANGMAKELNISEDIGSALQILAQGQSKKVDALYINNMLSLHMSDVGLNARLIKYFEAGNMRGRWGYARVALKVFFSRQFMRASITHDNETIKRKALMIVLANASKYGTGAVINPNGNPYDGIFEVVIIKQMGLITLLKMWLNPLGLSPDHIEVIKAKKVHIRTQRKMHFQVDGEYLGKVQHIDAYIAPAQVNIILPKESE